MQVRCKENMKAQSRHLGLVDWGGRSLRGVSGCRPAILGRRGPPVSTGWGCAPRRYCRLRLLGYGIVRHLILVTWCR